MGAQYPKRLVLAAIGFSAHKKKIPRAVDRNRVKRLARESFRKHRSLLPAKDYLIFLKTSGQEAKLLTYLGNFWKIEENKK